MTNHTPHSSNPKSLGIDENSFRKAVLRAVVEAKRAPLAEAEPVPGPAVYVAFLAIDRQRLATHPELGTYATDLLTGAACCYIGCATDAEERMARHVLNLSRSSNLDPRCVWISHVPTETLGAALHAEWILLKSLSAAWSTPQISGFDSKPQARPRLRAGGQRPSRWDCLHQRDWAVQPTTSEVATARLALAITMLQRDGRDRLWQPLTNI